MSHEQQQLGMAGEDPVGRQPTEPGKEPLHELGRIAQLWQRARQLGFAEPLFRLGTTLLTLTVVVLVVFGLSNIVQHFRSPAPGSGEAAAPLNDAPTGQALAPDEVPQPEALVAYSQSDTLVYSGISRQAEPQTIIPSRPRVSISTYVVQPGDNVYAIAELFNLKPETILWGNYETLKDNPRYLQIDQELTILPTDGVYYRYNIGEPLTAIAAQFGVTVEAIVEYPGNTLDPYEIDPANPAIPDGTLLIIPGGERETVDWGPPKIDRTDPASAAYYGAGHCGEIPSGPVGDGIFIWPTLGRYLSGYDYNPNIHPAIDIGGAEGNAVWASDDGVVVFAGESAHGYGNLIVIDHGKGWQSAYAHLQYVSVGCGDSVYSGSTIGTLGNTGNSSGPHLHFELRSDEYGKVNPLNWVIDGP